MSATGENEAPNPETLRTQYEFGAEQNALMGDLGSKMQFVGMFAIAIGGLVLIGAVLTANDPTPNPAEFIAGLLYIAIGAWTRSAGTEFREVVATKGADITHLMGALGNVRRIYTLFYWICIIALALLAISLLVMMFWNSSLNPGPEITARLAVREAIRA